MYCITSNILGKIMYLAWQSPVWDDDGYFWTDKKVVTEILYNNTQEHPFLFGSKEEAVKHLRALNIPQKCRIVRWSA